MIVSVLSPSPSPSSSLLSTPLFLRPCGIAPLSRHSAVDRSHKKKWKQGGRRGKGICRAELAQDAPFAAAIGACVLTSLVFPVSSGGPDDEEDGGGGGAIDSTDARFAVMGIIGFIPYFNWMSWVFAWLDSGRQRYLVYSIVYLVPYLRTNLSLSPDESWLPIASILVCILHIQLEASIRNGDLKLFSPLIKKKDTQLHSHKGFSKKGRNNQVELPSAPESRNDFQDWGVPRKSAGDPQHLHENPDKNSKEKSSD